MTHPDLLVGLGTADDAGVFRLPGSGRRALVQSVDYFTPIVDDPGDWGRIAAANALSDIYAMGATPLIALQLLGWPREDIPLEIAGQVVAGGAELMAKAGCVIVGGHTIDLEEPIYGFAVTGLADADSVVTNAGARVGDRLVLTKPLGSGIVATAHKADACRAEVLAQTVAVMATLNDVAGSHLGEAHAATDITGFGLLGHLAEMLDASRVGATIHVDQVPFIDGAEELYAGGFYPGGSRRNLEAVGPRLAGDLARAPLLADAQTSGGLLVALAPDSVSRFFSSVPGSVEVGEITDREGTIELA